MKKRLRIPALAAALLMLLALASCRTDVVDPEPTPPGTTEPVPTEPTEPTEPTTTEPVTGAAVEVDTALIDERYTDPGGRELLNVAYELPKLPYDDIVMNMAAYYDNLFEKIAVIVQSSMLEAANEAREYAAETNGIFTPHYVYGEYEIKRNDGLVFSVLRTETAYTGGVHESGRIYSETFTMKNGGLLTLDDLFILPWEQAGERLRQLVMAEADARRAEDDGLYYPNFEEILMERFDKADFFLTDTQLGLYWQEYTIAPYSSGAQIFLIELTELADMLSAEWISR